MKKKKKLLKTLLLLLVVILSSCALGSFVYYKSVTHGVSLDINKLEETKNVFPLKIYDSNQNEIKSETKNYIKISKLSKTTVDAFISAEDKRFYSHKGIDFFRVGGALVSNIKSRSFSQGASTISQQLIKNTQLSNEKTISRKLKELKLTTQLEKKYSKDEILEMYLNNIYFGNGCYGIENASQHYFGKSATQLTVAESALLAGTINAPSFYDIEDNFQKANERKNLILSLMFKQNNISEDTYKTATSQDIELHITKSNQNSHLYNEILNEAKQILNLNETQLKNRNYKIYTQIDTNLETQISNSINFYNIETNPNVACIVLDNNTHNIVSYVGSKNVLSKNWQPGSTIKPILVYAPAIEYNILNPATKILDEKINISGYSPENADKKYHGYVSARTSLSSSYNIPSVKILNELGIEKAKTFAKKMGIEFVENDNNLALALGGFTNGIKPQSLCDCYSTFANGGKFAKSKFISKITMDEKTIYTNQATQTQTMKESTAFLITDMLKDTCKTGTAKRLKNFDFDLASKTGTVGKSTSTKNVCAYNICYTTQHTILTIICGNDLPEKINGATYPTMINKDILSSLYKNNKPNNFKIPNDVIKINFDKEEYENNNKIVETENQNSLTDYFSSTFKPVSNTPKSFKLTAINFKNSKPILCFTLNKNYNYTLVRTHKKREETLLSSFDINNKNSIKFEDFSAKSGEIYEYKLKICEKNSNEEFYSNTIKLKVY